MSLGFLVCLTLGMALASAGSAGAQTSPYCQYPGAAANYPQYSCVGATTTVSVLPVTATTATGATIPITGENAAIPLAAAAGLMIIVLGARQLRQRANN